MSGRRDGNEEEEGAGWAGPRLKALAHQPAPPPTVPAGVGKGHSGVTFNTRNQTGHLVETFRGALRDSKRGWRRTTPAGPHTTGLDKTNRS